MRSRTASQMPANHSKDAEMTGWLYKWTNYLKGYQKRWFVVNNGLLSYYRNQEEMSHTCRGSIRLDNAVVHTEDSVNFVVSNSATQTFHLKASTEVEKQSWITAIEISKSRAIRQLESEEDEEYGNVAAGAGSGSGAGTANTVGGLPPLQQVLKVLGSKLEDLRIGYDLIQRNHAPLQQALIELEQLKSASQVSEEKIKTINERATLFRITSNAMINTCVEFYKLVQENGARWYKLLQHENQQRLHLEEMVVVLANQHSSLEQAAKKAHHNPNAIHSDDDEFYDAEEQVSTDFIVTLHNKSHKHEQSFPTSQQALDNDVSSDTEAESEVPGEEATVVARHKTGCPEPAQGECGDPTPLADEEEEEEIQVVAVRSSPARRTRIPYKPDIPLSLWSIMKTCIGKELTKIPMPVNFNEPLSTLQRLTEEYEYSALLDRAARCQDSCEQMALVAAFTVSAYATTSNRTGKPFNPLLGETYECDRTDDLGWKCISEQVSHHPPMLAQHCEGEGWTVWQEFSMSSKFRGKYLQVIPLGVAHLEFKGSEDGSQGGGGHYTWRKVTTTVHNIIVGKLWVDHHGEMDIVNHTTGDMCHLRFEPYSYFSRDTPRKVKGVVTNAEGAAKWVLQGTWDSKLEVARVERSPGSVKGKPLLETATPRVAWRRAMPPPEYERMYNFTVLACQLNEPEPGVAPTDSRLRPDQRLMEEGRWDEANATKQRLEEKQRATRHRREQEAEQAAAEGRPYLGYEPTWFKKQNDPVTGNPIHVYGGQYWDCKQNQDWSRCPDIFL